MMRIAMTVSMVVLLAACSNEGSSTDDAFDNTSTTSAPGTAPTDRDPTPQTGTGGQSPVDDSPTGTEKR
jgi:hypothetical protein